MTQAHPPSQTRISARDLSQAKAAADQVRRLDAHDLTAEHLAVLANEIALIRAARRQRARCNARTRRGTACAALSEVGSRRCRRHGGKSTGPRTAEGKARIGELARARMIARWAVRRKETRDGQQGG